MGIEQGTPVAYSGIDLLHNIIDLHDLRLPRAFKGWTEFNLNHGQQIDKIGAIQPAEVVPLARELSSVISRAIGIDIAGSNLNPVSEEKVVQLTNIISGRGNRIIFMRHGEQSPPEWISSLSNPALRKIRMMHDPFNRQDLLTNNALIDVFVTALVLLHVQGATGRKTQVLSSENLRAKEAAQVISYVIPGSTLSTREGLNCIIYKDEIDKPPVTEEQLLEDLPSGAMPWDPELVDRLCKKTKSGERQSEVIIKTIEGLLQYGTQEEGENLVIALTHNQQIAEVLRQTGKLENPYIRFPELTMLVVRSINDCVVFERGILEKVMDNKEVIVK